MWVDRYPIQIRREPGAAIGVCAPNDVRCINGSRRCVSWQHRKDEIRLGAFSKNVSTGYASVCCSQPKRLKTRCSRSCVYLLYGEELTCSTDVPRVPVINVLAGWPVWCLENSSALSGGGCSAFQVYTCTWPISQLLTAKSLYGASYNLHFRSGITEMFTCSNARDTSGFFSE